MNKKNLIYLVITIVFILLILININLNDILKSIQIIGLKTIFLCLLVHFCVYALRCLTMSIFLHKNISFFYLLNAHFVHNFYLSIIPASLGELSLPILLEKFVPKSKSFSILLITRFINLLIIIVLFIISIILIFRDMIYIKLDFNKLLILIFTIILILLLLYIFYKIKLYKLPFLNKIFSKIYNIILNIKIIIKDLSFTKLILLIIITLLYILFLALFYYIILQKINISFNLIQLIFIMSIQVAILILPIKTFGGFGTSEGSWMIGMMALGIDKKIALETGFTIHLISLLSAFIFFIIGLLGKKYLDNKYNKIPN